MTRCKSCLIKAEPLNGRCSVCGNEQNKTSSDLTPAEKKVRLHARGIRAVAVFHLVGAGAGLLMIAYGLAPAPLLVLAVINLLLAFGLDRYSLLAYKAATAYYFLIGMVNVISIQQGVEHLGGIALALIALYLIGNGTSKAIFDRQPSNLA